MFTMGRFLENFHTESEYFQIWNSWLKSQPWIIELVLLNSYITLFISLAKSSAISHTVQQIETYQNEHGSHSVDLGRVWRKMKSFCDFPTLG
jgi:hypothetical protein